MCPEDFLSCPDCGYEEEFFSNPCTKCGISYCDSCQGANIVTWDAYELYTSEPFALCVGCLHLLLDIAAARKVKVSVAKTCGCGAFCKTTCMLPRVNV